MLERAQELVDRCQALSPQQLSELMKISDKLAGLNAARFAEWHTPFNSSNARPAIYAFDGDVYTGLAAENLMLRQLHTLRNIYVSCLVYMEYCGR